MLKILGCVALVISTHVFAGEIYKWTDENGKVHFGDKTNAPKQSQEVIVKPVSGTGAMPSKYNFKPSQKQATTKEGELASPEIMKCQELAEQFVLKASISERKAIMQQIISICPNWRFHCRASRSQPQKNSCIATREDFGGGLIKETH